MAEAGFPLLGAVAVVLIVLPGCALAVKGALWALERRAEAQLASALNLRFLLLTSSSALPLAWLLSAALHQVESGRSAVACLFDHAAGARCIEPGFFALTLGAFLAARVFRVVSRMQRVQAADGARAHVSGVRIAALIDGRAALHVLRGRVVVTEEADFAIGTQGLLRPRVFVGAAFAACLSDDALATALGHEAEHVRSHDPLRWLCPENRNRGVFAGQPRDLAGSH